MGKNKHKDMDYRGMWFKLGEFYQLCDALEGNDKDRVYDLLFAIKKRGDLIND